MPTNDGARWNQRFRTEGWNTEPSSFLTSLDRLLPGSGSALDVAGGPGSNALWLAERGLKVTLVDISEVALDMAARRSQRLGIEIDLVPLDLESDAFPAGPWNLIICFHYQQRSLMPVMCESLHPGGMLVLELATRRNLERHQRPPAQYLLEEREAPDLVPGLEILVYEEGWLGENRHEARLVAKRPITGPSCANRTDPEFFAMGQHPNVGLSTPFISPRSPRSDRPGSGTGPGIRSMAPQKVGANANKPQ